MREELNREEGKTESDFFQPTILVGKGLPQITLTFTSPVGEEFQFTFQKNM